MKHAACAVLGIDLSSHALDLVLLDENTNQCEWTRLDLEGGDSFDRCRRVPEVMPQPGWYEAHGVYLAAIEKPYGPSRRAQSVLMRVQGAILASIPERILVWEADPTGWRRELGLKGNASKEECAANVIELADLIPLDWPQDAYDAWAVAYWAREENRRRLERRIA